jgi:hypothetical protein
MNRFIIKFYLTKAIVKIIKTISAVILNLVLNLFQYYFRILIIHMIHFRKILNLVQDDNFCNKKLKPNRI